MSSLPTIIDAACDRFEEEWKAGRRPPIESYLAGFPEPGRPDLVRSLLCVELELRRRRGEEPVPQEYRARLANYGELVDAAFVQEPSPPRFQAHRPEGSRPATDLGRDPLNYVPTSLTRVGGHAAPNGVENDPASVGPGGAPWIGLGQAVSRFRILREHAKGGLGEVFVASDTELNREVALKEIRHDRAFEPESQARFVMEAEVTGRLEHPGIVPVYGMGHYNDGRPYYAMRFIQGDTLSEAIGRSRRPEARGRDPGARGLEFLRLLSRFIGVCDAIAYAHSRGVLHRDLKPSNILLGGYGETLVVDWGLAKILGPAGGEPSHPPGGGPPAPSPAGEVDREAQAVDSGLTRIAEPSGGPADVPGFPLVPLPAYALGGTMPGQPLGTPSYMSPEQANGRLDLMGPASDVYGLGATLYFLLTGRAPFEKGNCNEVVARVRRGDFPPPRQVDPAVPPALEAVCLKAMALRPEDRYPSPRALASDIEHWMADEPVSAWREPWALRAFRWVRRHKPFVAGVAAAVAVAVLAAGTAVVLNNRRLAVLRSEAQELILRGRAASSSQDDPHAKLCLSAALAKIGAEPSLAGLRANAVRFLAEADRRLAEREAVRAARATYERFLTRRDDAWFHGSLLTGLNPADDLKATKAACREALTLFGVDADSGAAPALQTPHLGDRERAEVVTGCYELLLLLAEAESTRLPDQPADDSRPRRALGILDVASRFGPPTRALHLRRAGYLAALGDRRGAGSERERAAVLEPANAVDEFLLGDQFYQGGDPTRAIPHLDGALRWQPEHFWAQYFLAVCYLRLQRPAEAKACLTACLSRRPGFLWPYVYRGFAHGELNAFPAAEADFRKALELGPGDDATYTILVNRGVMRIRQGWPEGAIDDLDKAVALKPLQYQAHVDLAHAYEKQGRWDKAAGRFDEAVRLAPGLAAVHRTRARFHLDRRDTAAALRDFEEAIRLEPPSGGSAALAGDHTERARILLHDPAKRYTEAAEACDAALALSPEYPAAHLLRAEALLKLGRFAESAAALDRYLRNGGPTADVLRVRGAVRAKLGDYAGAVEDDTRALANKADPDTYCHRGWAYVFCEAWRLALRDFEAAIRLDPRQGDAYNGRGYALVKSGDYPRAVEDADEALRRHPEDAEMTFNIACIFALAAGAAEADGGRPDRQDAAASYRERALEVLVQALDRLPDAQRMPFWRDRVLSDHDLDPIRQSPAFARLGAKYGGPVK